MLPELILLVSEMTLFWCRTSFFMGDFNFPSKEFRCSTRERIYIFQPVFMIIIFYQTWPKHVSSRLRLRKQHMGSRDLNRVLPNSHHFDPKHYKIWRKLQNNNCKHQNGHWNTFRKIKFLLLNRDESFLSSPQILSKELYRGWNQSRNTQGKIHGADVGKEIYME